MLTPMSVREKLLATSACALAAVPANAASAIHPSHMKAVRIRLICMMLSNVELGSVSIELWTIDWMPLL